MSEFKNLCRRLREQFRSGSGETYSTFQSTPFHGIVEFGKLNTFGYPVEFGKLNAFGCPVEIVSKDVEWFLVKSLITIRYSYNKLS